MIKLTVECRGVAGPVVTIDLTGEEAEWLAYELAPDHTPRPDGDPPDNKVIRESLADELEHYANVLRVAGINRTKR